MKPGRDRIRVVRAGNMGQLIYVVLFLRARDAETIVVRRWLAAPRRWAQSKRTIPAADVIGCPTITARLRRTINDAIAALPEAPALTQSEKRQ